MTTCQEPTDQRSRLLAHSLCKVMVKDHYLRLIRAVQDGKPLAWCSSMGPTELLRAMGFEVFYPENRAAVIGAARLAEPAIVSAGGIGYAASACSYMTSDIGSARLGVDDFAQRLECPPIPQPDVLVVSSQQCREVIAWFEYYAERYQAPLVNLILPNQLEDIKPNHLDAGVKDYAQIIAQLEPIVGAKLDYSRLARTTGLARDAALLWRRCLLTSKRCPSPWSFSDQLTLMAPIVIMRGTSECVEFYARLLTELEAQSESQQQSSRIALYWEGMPIWGKLREHAEFLASMQTDIVASTYCQSWDFSALEPEDALRSSVAVYAGLFINHRDCWKLQFMEEMLSTYKPHGIVYMNARTCPHNSNTEFAFPHRLFAKTNLPYVVIHSDMNDLRCHNEPLFRTTLEAFIEQLRENQP